MSCSSKPIENIIQNLDMQEYKKNIKISYEKIENHNIQKDTSKTKIFYEKQKGKGKEKRNETKTKEETKKYSKTENNTDNEKIAKQKKIAYILILFSTIAIFFLREWYSFEHKFVEEYFKKEIYAGYKVVKKNNINEIRRLAFEKFVIEKKVKFHNFLLSIFTSGKMKKIIKEQNKENSYWYAGIFKYIKYLTCNPIQLIYAILIPVNLQQQSLQEGFAVLFNPNFLLQIVNYFESIYYSL